MEPPPKPIGKEVFVEIRFPGRIASTVETAVLRLEGLQVFVRERECPGSRWSRSRGGYPFALLTVLYSNTQNADSHRNLVRLSLHGGEWGTHSITARSRKVRAREHNVVNVYELVDGHLPAIRRTLNCQGGHRLYSCSSFLSPLLFFFSFSRIRSFRQRKSSYAYEGIHKIRGNICTSTLISSGLLATDDVPISLSYDVMGKIDHAVNFTGKRGCLINMGDVCHSLVR